MSANIRSLVLLLLMTFFALYANPQNATAKPIVESSTQTTGASGSAVDSQAFVAWAKAHAIPLKTVEAGNGFSDLQKLGPIVGDARIVGLGEATHGTHEFFQLKHRMLEFLATQKGFTIFSIEANMPEAYRLNDYVLHGTGDPKELLKGMYFWTWNTQEVLAMIEWMRQFNQSGQGHLEFTGFDMQTPTVSMEIVRKFVEAHEPSYLDAMNLTYQQIASLKAGNIIAGNSESTAELQMHAATICRHLEDERAWLIKQADEKEVDWIIQNARLVEQFTRLKGNGNARDEAMAENVKWIADHNPGAKIVVWAHNAHVGRGTNESFKPMGSYLSKWFGKDYVTLGFAFNEGSFRAVEVGKSLREFTVGSSPEGSLDRALAATGIPVLALDLRQLPTQGAAAQWLDEPHLTHRIGATYSDQSPSNYFSNLRPEDAYDALLFVAKTSAARGN